MQITSESKEYIAINKKFNIKIYNNEIIMGLKIEQHPVTLRFLGAVDGNVVPSGTVLSVTLSTQEKSTNILIDSGSAIREETKEGQNMDGLIIPSNIDAVVITHTHTDHCGALPEVVSKNPKAPVFAPE